jgi:hypothetical protein
MYCSRYSFRGFVETWISSTYFEKYSNSKFRENPSSWSRVDLREQIDLTKLIVAFRNFTNAPSQCIYVLCVDIRRNNDYFPMQSHVIGFYNQDVCKK